MSKAQYLKFLLNNARCSVHPYLTSGLIRLSQYCLESPSDLLTNQTLAPLFMHFQPKYRLTLFDCLMSSQGAKAIRACQLVTLREKTQLTLKYCPSCADCDVKDYGVSYWHRLHQIPGVESCFKHDVYLEHIQASSRCKIEVGMLPPLHKTAKACGNNAVEFSRYAVRVLNAITKETSAFQFNSYHSQLKKYGYLTRSGSIRRHLLMDNLFNFTQTFGTKQNELFPSSGKDIRYITSLMSGKFAQHPTKYLLLGFWLANQVKTEVIHKTGKNNLSTKRAIENACSSLLRQGESMASVSRKIGKSRCYVKALALRLNIPVNLKPYLMTDEIKSSIMFLANKGFHRCAISQRVGVSVGSVEQQISTSPALVLRRQKCKQESMRRRYKCEIIRFIKANPFACREQVKNACYAAFYWLYRHNPLWLDEYLPKPQPVKTNARIDWHKRDIAAQKKVSSILDMSELKLSKTKLEAIIDGRGWLTKYKDKMPLSIQAFTQYHRNEQ